jgi:hypothetical protein
LVRRQTTRQPDGAVATNRLIASRDEVLVCHMNLRNAGRLASNSGQLSGKSGRDRPRFNSVLSRTRQNRSGAERSIQINMMHDRQARALAKLARQRTLPGPWLANDHYPLH